MTSASASYFRIFSVLGTHAKGVGDHSGKGADGEGYKPPVYSAIHPLKPKGPKLFPIEESLKQRHLAAPRLFRSFEALEAAVRRYFNNGCSPSEKQALERKFSASAFARMEHKVRQERRLQAEHSHHHTPTLTP